MFQTNSAKLSDLYKENNSKANERAKNCKSYKVRYSKKNPDRYIFLVKCKESYSNSSGHIVSMVFKRDEDNRFPLNAEVNIKCSCPAWKYWGSDYNSTIQSYWLDTKENRYPMLRDPALTNKICKHVARVRLDLRNMTFSKLDKKKRLIEASESFQVVSIQDCRNAILSYFESKNIEGGLTFFNSLTEDNFEEKLLSAGVIN